MRPSKCSFAWILAFAAMGGTLAEDMLPSPNLDGVWVESSLKDGFNASDVDEDGFRVYRAGNHGVSVRHAYECGVSVEYAGNPSATETSPFSNGVSIAGAEGYGLFVGHSDLSGVRVSSTNYHGLYVVDSDDDAVRVNNTSGDGVRVSKADGSGIYANTTASGGNYGFYTPDNLYSSNYHSKGAQMQVVQYQGEEDLLPGDPVVFAGILPPEASDQPPTVLVAKVLDGHTQSIAGVAYRRYDEEGSTAEDRPEEVPREKHPLTSPGSIQPNDTLLVVTHGPALVNINAETEKLDIGDPIAISASGQAEPLDIQKWNMSHSAPSRFATALQPLEAGEGQVWAFVTCH